jgi:hypothetical protein
MSRENRVNLISITSADKFGALQFGYETAYIPGPEKSD